MNACRNDLQVAWSVSQAAPAGGHSEAGGLLERLSERLASPRDSGGAASAGGADPARVTTAKDAERRRTAAPEPAGSQLGGPREAHSEPLYDGLALQCWLLVACQDDEGLRDKPGKFADFYHTCYCLSGLSSSQDHCGLALGGRTNRLASSDACTNVLPAALRQARAFFSNDAAAAARA